jgi:asparagine synthase (glutamine-hydrolysing)
MVAKALWYAASRGVLEADISEMVPRLVSHFDEPFGDFSIFPTFLVSEMARRFVTVALSGDGGDEIFAGYDTYVAQKLDTRLYGRLPRWLRQQFLPRLLDLPPPQPAKKGLDQQGQALCGRAALCPKRGSTPAG